LQQVFVTKPLRLLTEARAVVGVPYKQGTIAGEKMPFLTAVVW
jgi:hypothetical protein